MEDNPLRCGLSEPSRGHLPTGALPWARGLSHGNLGRREADPQLSLSQHSRPFDGTERALKGL
eukprot:15471855-Alexandrium_andersonii.AAC.1